MELVLDLGDLFTKGIAAHGGQTRRLRYPSAVARRLLSDAGGAPLVLDDDADLVRPETFDPADYPRTRSYPGSEQFLDDVRGRVAPHARFAGWPAAAHGSDRELLGTHPTRDNVDALVRKALILLTKDGFDCTDVSVRFVVDVGPKAAAIADYARKPPRVAIAARDFHTDAERRLSPALRCSVVDAADCAIAALPDALAFDQVERVLVVDIGYLRTKLAIASAAGCEHQPQPAPLGMSDCVRRILRDGQDQGLVEDELAVVRALERARADEIEVAGRRFSIGRVVAGAERALVVELARAVERATVDHFARRGEPCRAIAVVGGGAAVIGNALVDKVRTAGIGIDTGWVSPAPSFALVEGGLRTHTNA